MIEKSATLLSRDPEEFRSSIAVAPTAASLGNAATSLDSSFG